MSQPIIVPFNPNVQPMMTPVPQMVAPPPGAAIIPVHRPSIPNLLTTVRAVQRFRAPLVVAGPRPMVAGMPPVRAVVPVQIPIQDPLISDRARILSTAVSTKSRKSTAKIAPDASYLESDEVVVEKVNQYECCECCGGHKGRCPLWLLVILSIVVFLIILGIVLVVVFTLVKF